MKVIRELIDYFVSASALTEDDLRYLLEKGWRRGEPGEIHFNSDGTVIHLEPTAVGTPLPPPEDPYAIVEIAPVRKRSGPKPRSSEATAKTLETWLRARLDACREAAGALDGLAESGKRGLRDLTPPQAAALIRASVEKRRIGWSALWAALLANDHRGWFDQPGARGRATQAFRALVSESPASELGKYRWLLSHPAVAEAVLLAGAQRALLRGVYHLLEHDAGWIVAQLGRGRCPSALLTLALAEAGRRFDRTTAVMPAGEMPDRALPEIADRLRALHAAALMHPATMLPFLAYCGSLWEEGTLEQADSYACLQLACREEWHLGKIPADEAFKPLPLRFLIDASVNEEVEAALLAKAAGIRTAARLCGVTELRVMIRPLFTAMGDCLSIVRTGEEIVFQVHNFTNAATRIAFNPALMNEVLVRETGLKTASGAWPSFVKYETSLRKSLIL